jgi:hypothetical protein
MRDTDELKSMLRVMPRKSRRQMLTDVIGNMHERDDADEIMQFLIQQLGGDTEYVITNYWERKP